MSASLELLAKIPAELETLLGNEHEALIGTVRNVGYKFVNPAEARGEQADKRQPNPGEKARA